MKSLARLALFAGIALMVCAAARAQEKQAPAPAERTPLKITLVLHEYNGKQEIASLPYELSVSALEGKDTKASGRIGTRIPIQTEKDKYTYFDLGTSYDCFVSATSEGRFRVESEIDRSSVAPTDAKSAVAGEEVANPRVASLRLSFDVILRDGETSEAATATDPLTGNVWRVEVRLKVLK
jgi:hypothetical protein